MSRFLATEFNSPLVDPQTGKITKEWQRKFANARVIDGGSVPSNQPNGSAIFAADNDGTGTTLAVNGTYTPFGSSANFAGAFLVDNLSDGTVGLFLQGAAIVALVAQTGATYSTTAHHAATINVYLVSNVITIENKLAGSVEVRAMGFRIRSAA